MATMQLVVNIATTASGSGFTATVAGVRNLSGGIAQANKEAGSLLGTIGKMGAAIGVASLAWKGFDALKSMITQGIEFNATLESSKLGMGALISAMTNISDSTGRALTGTEKLNAAMRISGGIQAELQVMALKTSASYDSMVSAMGAALGPALTAKMDLAKGEIQKFVLAVTQMAGAVDQRLLENGQLNQEIRGILEGDTSKNSRLGNILYGDVKDPRATIKRLQEEGKFYDWVMEKMAAYGIAGERAAQTYSGALSNLKDAFQQALGEGTQGAFGQVTQLLLDLTNKIVTFDAQGRATFNPEFVRAIEAVTRSVVDLASALATLGPIIAPLATTFSVVFNTALAGVTKLFKFLLFDLLDLWAEGFGWIGDQLAKLANSSQIAGKVFGGVAQTFQGWRDSVNEVEKKIDSFTNRAAGRAADAIIGTRTPGAAAYTGTGGLTVTARPGSAADPDKAAIRLGNAVDDLTASTEIFIATQAKLANAAAFEALFAKEDAALKAIDTSRALHAATTRTELAKELDPIRKLQIERRVAYQAMDGDVAQFLAEQSKKQLEIRAAFQALDDELSKFQAGQDKQLQDLMQRGVTFGSDNYKQVLGDQATQLEAFTETQAKLRENLNAKLQALGLEQSDFEAVQNALRVALTAESDQEISDATFEQLTARVDREREALDEIYRLNRTFAQRMEDTYADMAKEITNSIKSSVTVLLEGGTVQDAVGGLVSFVNDAIAESFAGLFENFFAKMAAHAQGQPAAGEVGPPTRGQVTGAKYGMAAIQGGAALYGMYTNPAPTQGQNMLTGAMSGAAIGATFSWVGAIVGALVGALAGAFAPTQEGKNVRINGTAEGITITGLDDGQDWGTAKLTKAINSAIRSTAAKLDAIFLGLPTAALEAMAGWRPNLNTISVLGKGDGKNWNEELDNYLKETLPSRVFSAYGGAIQGALKFAGVTDERLKQFTAYLKTLKTDEAIQALNDYVSVLYGFAEIMEMFGVKMGEEPPTSGRRRAVRSGSGPADWTRGDEFARNVYKRADRGPLGDFEDTSKRIAAYSGGVEGLTHEELVARGQQILSLSQDFFGGIADYLLKLRDMQKSMTEGINAQKRDITLDQMRDKPKQQIEFLLAEQRRLRDELEGASSAEEVNRIIARMQDNAGSLYDLMGRSPAAAAQIQKMLDDMLKVANERYKIFEDNAKKMLDDAFAMVNAILKRLQEGIEATFPDTGENEDKGPPGGSDPTTGGPGGGKKQGTDLLNESATSLATQFDTKFAPSIAMAHSNVVSFAEALERAAAAVDVRVDQGDINVDVNVSGDTGLIGRVSATATQAATTKIVSAVEGSQRRRSMSGR